tara:strand:- start:60 stop:446 length:387 start_codon:yes stop_codon:yes gene_type:complete
MRVVLEVVVLQMVVLVVQHLQLVKVMRVVQVQVILVLAVAVKDRWELPQVVLPQVLVDLVRLLVLQGQVCQERAVEAVLEILLEQPQVVEVLVRATLQLVMLEPQTQVVEAVERITLVVLLVKLAVQV